MLKEAIAQWAALGDGERERKARLELVTFLEECASARVQKRPRTAAPTAPARKHSAPVELEDDEAELIIEGPLLSPAAQAPGAAPPAPTAPSTPLHPKAPTTRLRGGPRLGGNA
jgi:hypothetical protein